MIYAFTGAHGTGKTTSVGRLMSQIKINYPDKTVHPLVDQEAICPYPINKDTSPEAQMWIFTRIINRELTLLKQFDVIVSDRTAVDAAAYTYVAGMESLAADMLDMAAHHMHVYKRIVFRRVASNGYCFTDGCRESADSTYRRQVELTLANMYARLVDNGALLAEDLVYE